MRLTIYPEPAVERGETLRFGSKRSASGGLNIGRAIGRSRDLDHPSGYAGIEHRLARPSSQPADDDAYRDVLAMRRRRSWICTKSAIVRPHADRAALGTVPAILLQP